MLRTKWGNLCRSCSSCNLIDNMTCSDIWQGKLACLQAHVRAMEKGHPLAASKAAWASPSSPYTPAPTFQIPDAVQQGLSGMQPGLCGLQSAVPGAAWVDAGLAMGKGYSPRGYSGLDGVGQALSAALQVCSTLPLPVFACLSVCL